jgi:putative ABC transport system permease protein
MKRTFNHLEICRVCETHHPSLIMSILRLILASFIHHWRTNLAVSAGAAVGTAVLTGALLVGDSMQGSLRSMALDRLGLIDEALVSDHFFRAQLADELEKTATGDSLGSAPAPVFSAPAIILPASMENPAAPAPLRANRVELIGCDRRFWQLDSRPIPVPTLQDREIALNRPLAEKLGVKPGDEVILRLPRPGAIPADSALGRKNDTVQSFRLAVKSVVPAEGLGSFALNPTQRQPLNAYINLQWLQERLELPGLANAILVHLQDDASRPNFRANENGTVSFAAASAAGSIAQNLLRPKLIDLGLDIEKTPLGYFNITSARMIFDPGAEKEILLTFARLMNQGRPTDGRKIGQKFILDGSLSKQTSIKTLDGKQREGFFTQSAFTYLANTIADGQRTIPYSTITAIDFTDQAPLGAFLSADGKPLPPLKDDEIALNSWAADDLKAKPGDQISVAYFLPETADGQTREVTKHFRLAAVVQLAGAAGDRALTPTVKGMTDEATMSDWDPPFPFDSRRVRPQDEKYWNQYGPTPKAFVSLQTGRRLWSSRFGQTTSIRVSTQSLPSPFGRGAGGESQLLPSPFGRGAGGEGLDKGILEKRLSSLDPAAFGLLFQPVKRQALSAAAGTTPFNVLFLAFSFFIIAAGAMLVLLLFRLGVEQRAGEIGILSALGFKRRQVRRLLLGEGLIIATVGGILGLILGVGYAALLLLGLRTWWLAAITAPFLQFYLTPTSLIIGLASGIVLALAAIAFSIRGITRIEPRRLLAGQTTLDIVPEPAVELRKQSPLSLWERVRVRADHKTMALYILLLISIASVAVLLLLGGLKKDYRPAAFFGAGAGVLLSLLGFAWISLRSGRFGPAVAAGRGNLLRMALRNAARNPGRGTLTLSLVSAACFLIVALSAFRLDPTRLIPALASGNGGFSLAAETDQPIYQNLDTPQGRAELGFSQEDENHFAGCKAFALRVQSGDDASCLNLYRPRRPRILGLPKNFIDRGGFSWADRGLSQFSRSENDQDRGLSQFSDRGLSQFSRRGLSQFSRSENDQDRGLSQFSRSENDQDRGLSQFSRSENGTVPLNTASTNLSSENGTAPFRHTENGTIPLISASNNPWKLLEQKPKIGPDDVPCVPVILEQNTANYSLNLWKGPGEIFEISDAWGEKIRLQVAALLGNSIFQGDLLLSEENLLKLFPQTAGYRFFLLETPPDKTKAVQTILERALSDYGFSAQTTAERLAGFMAVQNTYISAFQSLGGLGLLLGTLGLAAVQMRNIVERRGELALLRAIGFRRRRLAALVIWENFALLIAGLACGVISALVAILPHLITRDASIPWFSLAVTLALVLIVGLASGLIATAGALRAPLLTTLREDR